MSDRVRVFAPTIFGLREIRDPGGRTRAVAFGAANARSTHREQWFFFEGYADGIDLGPHIGLRNVAPAGNLFPHPGAVPNPEQFQLPRLETSPDYTAEDFFEQLGSILRSSGVPFSYMNADLTLSSIDNLPGLTEELTPGAPRAFHRLLRPVGESFPPRAFVYTDHVRDGLDDHAIWIKRGRLWQLWVNFEVEGNATWEMIPSPPTLDGSSVNNWMASASLHLTSPTRYFAEVELEFYTSVKFEMLWNALHSAAPMRRNPRAS